MTGGPSVRFTRLGTAACMLLAGCATAPRGPAASLDLEQAYLIGPSTAAELGYRIDFQAQVNPERRSGIKQIAIEGDSIFVLDGMNFLSRLRGENGKALWRLPVAEATDEIQGIIYLPEAGRVFLTENGDLLVLDVATGSLLSRQPLDQMASTAPVAYGPFLIYGAINGQVVWHSWEVGYQWRGYRVAPSMRLAPLLVGNYVVAIGSDGRIMVLDASSAVGIWEKQLLGEVVAPPATTEGVLFVAGQDQYLWAIDIRSGRTDWKYMAAAPLDSPPAVIGDRVYQPIPGQGLVCFEARPSGAPEGRIIWSAPVAGTVRGRIGERLLVWDDRANRMTLLDSSRGGVVRTVDLPHVRHVHVEMPQGAMVAGGDDGRVIRLVPR